MSGNLGTSARIEIGALHQRSHHLGLIGQDVTAHIFTDHGKRFRHRAGLEKGNRHIPRCVRGE